MCRDAHKKFRFSSKQKAKAYIKSRKGTPTFKAKYVYWCEDCQTWRITSVKPNPVRMATKSDTELVELAERIQASNPNWSWYWCLLRAGKHA